MIRSVTAWTYEIDDPVLAADQLLEQLEQEGGWDTYSVGIVSCFTEYLESGVVEEVCRRLPFEVAGVTTVASASPHEVGETMLSLLVMTSDTVQFSVGLSEPLTEEDDDRMKGLYDQAAVGLPGKPSLILAFVPLLLQIGNSFYVNSLDKASGGVPIFGTMAVDHNPDYHESQIICNGTGYGDRCALILLYGDVEPAFFIGSISDEKIFTDKSLVTASHGHILETVNHLPVVEYLMSLGLTRGEDGSIDGLNSFPLVMDYNDGTMPVIRAMIAVTPEGHVVCGGGDLPVGSTLSIGKFDGEDIRRTAARVLEQALEEKGKRTLLMFSCIGRYFALGMDALGEIELVRDRLKGEKLPYLFSYAGGEICPVSDRAGAIANRNHGSTFIICAL